MDYLIYNVNHEILEEFLINMYFTPKQLVPYMNLHNDNLGKKLNEAYKSQGHYGVLNELLPNERHAYCMKYFNGLPTYVIDDTITNMNDELISYLVRYLVKKYDEKFSDPFDHQMISHINVAHERNYITTALQP